VEHENALAAMAVKIRTRDEDIISLRTRLQEQGLQYAGDKQTYVHTSARLRTYLSQITILVL